MELKLVLIDFVLVCFCLESLFLSLGGLMVFSRLNSLQFQIRILINYFIKYSVRTKIGT